MRTPMELLAEHHLTAESLDTSPAVAFLQKDHAAILHTVLTNTFDVDRQQIEADVFEAEVASVLNTLREGGVVVPDRPIRDLCRGWVDDKWLALDPTHDGGQVYRQRYEMSVALGWVRDLSSQRPGTSASNVPRFLEKVEGLASKMSGDTEQRADLLRRRIADLEQELARLEDGIGEDVTFDEFVAEHDVIVEMLSGIDLGFRHVTEQLWRVQKRMLDDIALSGPDPIAQMKIGEDAWQELVSTPEGRAVDDALQILLDPTARMTLNRHLGQILAHEFAETMKPWERRAFGDLSALLHSHVAPLVDANRRGNVELNLAFRKQAARSTDHHGFDETIRRARMALRSFTRRSLPEGVVPRLPKLDLGNVPGRLPDLEPVADPTPLSEMEDSEATPPTAEEIARWSGPHIEQVTDHIDSTLATFGQEMSIGNLWALAPEHLRRSVELVGYHVYAHGVHSAGRSQYEPGKTEVVETLAPNGRLIPLTIQRIVLAPTSTEAEPMEITHVD